MTPARQLERAYVLLALATTQRIDAELRARIERFLESLPTVYTTPEPQCSSRPSPF